MKLRFFLTISTVLLALLGTALETNAATINTNSLFAVTDLGSLAGPEATARSIAPNGFTAGSATDVHGIRHEYVNEPDATNLPMNTHSDSAMATGVNSSGQVSGTQWINGQSFATIWGASDATERILAGPGSYANDINEFGQATGMITVGGAGHLFTTDIDTGQVIDLGTMPGGVWSSGYGINNLGEISGYSMSASGTAQAFLWNQDGYSTLQGLGGRNSYAMGISDIGGIAGHAQLRSGYMRAVLWLNGTVESLGTLGGNGSYAYGVNNHSQVVGYSWTEKGEQHAFVYANGLMLDLNTLIGSDSGWILTAAYAINDNGQIAGTGTYYGQVRAFRLDLTDLTIQIFGFSGPIGPTGGPGGGGPLPDSPGGFDQGLSQVPEPATAVLFLMGLGFLGIGKGLTRLQQKPSTPKA